MPRLRFASLSTISLLALALVGCGGDGPTGPSANFSLNGAWTLSIANATTTGINCSLNRYVVTFDNGSAGTLSTTGATSGTCVVDGRSSTLPLTGSTALTSVSYSGSTISFTWRSDSGTQSMTGSVQNDNRMAGSAAISLSFGGQVKPLNGSWTATRN